MKYLGLSILVALLSACGIQSPSEANLWAERVSRIEVGMRREEVERILDISRIGYGPSTTVIGSAQGCVYLVSAAFTVTVFYDFTGATRSGAGFASPENRVIQPAILSHRNEHGKEAQQARPDNGG